MTASPVGDWIFNAGGKDILPSVNYDQNLGSLTKKYLTLHTAELWAETLVAQNTIATIGGRILVGPTTVLTSDLAAAATSIIVKHNQMVSGNVVHMEANGKVERMAITSGPSGAGPYTYTVTRNLDGSGANDWFAGDAVFNTGSTGSGHIDIYSVAGILSGNGPTIAGNVRNSSTHSDISTHWAIGNLDGLYGYSGSTFGAAFGKYANSNSYVTIDATNGYRAITKNSAGTEAVRLQISAAGVMTLRDSAGVAKITLDANAGMTLDGKMQMLGSSSAIAIGVLPPLSSAIGTGLWQDRTGLYGILGVKQVETLIVLGTVTGTGDAEVIVTAANMVGSPRTVLVPVLDTDSASTVAGKVRTVLSADAIITAFFTVSGSGANVVLTDNYGRANDTSMLIEIDNDTCTGLTPATSTNTTAGSNTTQAKFDAATGAITAGAGAAILNSEGVNLAVGDDTVNQLKFKNGSTISTALGTEILSAGTQTKAVFYVNAEFATVSGVYQSNVFNSSGGGIILDIVNLGNAATNYAALYGTGGAPLAGVTIGANASPNAMLDVRSDSIIISTAKTPASASATGVQGMIAWDSGFIYICTATNTWKRAAIATW